LLLFVADRGRVSEREREIERKSVRV